ncbi:MAG: PaaI family thioesterase [Gammaproteobacteria bacterium]|nr:PaaI family thioesterase [Gammaproteobacteria bacterium]
MRLDTPANHCFVCGPNNPIGLKVKFRLESEGESQVCRAEFTPAIEHSGYDSMTHGGIIFSLLDDVMANYHFLQGQVVVTARMQIRYGASLPIGTPVALQARQVEAKGRLKIMQASACMVEGGQLVASAEGRFMRR